MSYVLILLDVCSLLMFCVLVLVDVCSFFVFFLY